MDLRRELSALQLWMERERFVGGAHSKGIGHPIDRDFKPTLFQDADRFPDGRSGLGFDNHRVQRCAGANIFLDGAGCDRNTSIGSGSMDSQRCGGAPPSTRAVRVPSLSKLSEPV